MALDWSKLAHAYGSAEDLPDILGTLTADPHDTGWEGLWSRVRHQGTTYSASPHVLPCLLDLAAGASAAGQVMPLFLTACIEASPEFGADGFAETVEHLHDLAKESVADPRLTSSDRIYLMSAMLTLGGNPIWGPALEGLVDGEFQASCPQCGVATAIPVDDAEPVAAADLNGMAARLYGVAIESSDQETAMGLRRLFGHAGCPECGATVRVAGAVERWQRVGRT